MTKVNIYEFRTHFAKYAKCVREGATITLCDHNKPFAEISPIGTTAHSPAKRPLGLYRRKVVMSADFDSPVVNQQIGKTFLSGASS